MTWTPFTTPNGQTREALGFGSQKNQHRPGGRAGDARARGVSSPHVIPTALVMVALPLLEATTSRAAIAIWLQELADAYDEKGEEGLGEDPEEADLDGAEWDDDEEAGVELDPADDEPDPDDEPAHEPDR